MKRRLFIQGLLGSGVSLPILAKVASKELIPARIEKPIPANRTDTGIITKNNGYVKWPIREVVLYNISTDQMIAAYDAYDGKYQITIHIVLGETRMTSDHRRNLESEREIAFRELVKGMEKKGMKPRNLRALPLPESVQESSIISLRILG